MAGAIPDGLQSVTGAEKLFEWFGYWPGFHDAEILDLTLSSTGKSAMRVHTWRMTNEVDASGYYICDRNIVVEFVFAEITELVLNDLSGVGIAMDIVFRQTLEGIHIDVSASFGLSGTITARSLHINLHPGKPDEQS